MIELKDVCYRYENAARPALDGVTLSIQEGEMLAIVGHNGSGKSTLAKHLNALLLPESGVVTVDGLDTKDENNTLAIRQQVGMVFQNPDNQLVTTIVEEDIAFGPENLGVPPEDIRKRVDGALAAVDMQAFFDRAPHMLSGGQKQRIAIAGMLAMQPRVLVLDEATAMLDPEGRREVLAIVQKLNREQCITVVIITQFMEEALLCNRVAVMAHGTIDMLGTPKEIFRQGAHLRELGLDVPAMVRIRDELAMQGTVLPGEPVTVSELADAIASVLAAGKGA
ncbi:MAG: energy-coupling factor transporter ATPase [Eubacteriales bacterium]|nr:energy-coupling factor transporter ATPase [Eubacteriales bacterium]